MSFDWKEVVRNVAPALGHALAGPMAGTAVSYLAEHFLGNPDATEGEVAEAVLSASPDSLLKLKQMDHDFEVQMAKLGVDIYRIKVEDTKSARELAKVNMVPQVLLSALFVSGYCAVLYGMLTGTVVINDGVKSEVTLILGVLTAGVVKILDFWFGSSFGSKEKTAALTARSS